MKATSSDTIISPWPVRAAEDTVLIPNTDGPGKAGASALTCPRCRASCRPHAKFCPTCGNNLMHVGDAEHEHDQAASPNPARRREASEPSKGKTRFLLGAILVLVLLIAASVAYLASVSSREQQRVEVLMQQKVAAAAENVAPATAAPREVPLPPPMPVSLPPGGVAVPAPAAQPDPVSAGTAPAQAGARMSRREAKRLEAARAAEAQQQKMEFEAAQAAEAERKRVEAEKAAEQARNDAAKQVSGDSWKQACNGSSGISRMFCLEKARWAHCRDRWNTTPECVANAPGQGQP